MSGRRAQLALFICVYFGNHAEALTPSLSESCYAFKRSYISINNLSFLTSAGPAGAADIIHG